MRISPGAQLLAPSCWSMAVCSAWQSEVSTRAPIGRTIHLNLRGRALGEGGLCNSRARMSDTSRPSDLCRARPSSLRFARTGASISSVVFTSLHPIDVRMSRQARRMHNRLPIQPAIRAHGHDKAWPSETLPTGLSAHSKGRPDALHTRQPERTCVAPTGMRVKLREEDM